MRFMMLIKSDASAEAGVMPSEERDRAELWERYVAGPESSDDPAAWKTELSRRLDARQRDPR